MKKEINELKGEASTKAELKKQEKVASSTFLTKKEFDRELNTEIKEFDVELDALEKEYVFFMAIPLKLKAMDGSPVRAFAIENDAVWRWT